MEKMDNLENLGNIQNDIAIATKLQRFLEQSDLSKCELVEKSHSWFFENVKREFANRLSILEAYFVSDCFFHNFETCQEILRFIDDMSCELGEFLLSLRPQDEEQEEESEVNNA